MLGRQELGALVFQRENRMRYVNTVQISDRQGGNTPEAPRPPCAPTQFTGQIQIANSPRRNAASRSKMPQTGPAPPRPLAPPVPPGAASATPSDSGSSPRLSPVTPRARSVLSFLVSLSAPRASLPVVACDAAVPSLPSQTTCAASPHLLRCGFPVASAHPCPAVA